VTIAVGILLFDGVELLDLAGPYEVFTVASRVRRLAEPDSPEPFATFTVSRSPGLVRTHAGLLIAADHTFSGHPPVEVLVVPGGVVDDARADPDVLGWIRHAAASSRLTTSVCTGAFLLADVGLLDGRAATTHWMDVDDLQAAVPTVRAVPGARWVDEGPVVTAAGISAGIDVSLHLVERLAGRGLALETARYMEYVWDEGPARRDGA
jgi:transcriptional regulator GlxA family with amidase domain